MVTATTKVVNPKLRQLRLPLLRVRWALKKRGGSRREWSLAAGRSHAQVTMMLRRLDAGETPAFEGKVFEDLARAAGVDAHWLQTGEGEPLAGAAAEVSAFEGAVGWFLATETHEGRGDDAKRFLAERDQVNRASLQKYF